jgi:hypothetical protein
MRLTYEEDCDEGIVHYDSNAGEGDGRSPAGEEVEELVYRA